MSGAAPRTQQCSKHPAAFRNLRCAMLFRQHVSRISFPGCPLAHVSDCVFVNVCLPCTLIYSACSFAQSCWPHASCTSHHLISSSSPLVERAFDISMGAREGRLSSCGRLFQAVCSTPAYVVNLCMSLDSILICPGFMECASVLTHVVLLNLHVALIGTVPALIL